MTLQTEKHWQMDPSNHNFPVIPGGLSDDARTILELLKVYDETCSDARATMIKNINELLAKGKTKE